MIWIRLFANGGRTGDGVISDFYMKELISVLRDIAKYLKKIAENSGDDGK